MGNSPAGASADQMQSEFSKFSLADRAKMIMNMPGELAIKQQKIKELYQKNGQTAPPEILQPGGGSAPGKGAPVKTAG
jgi:hypothetical protein